MILSRKGFDSTYGGCPSPILPYGTMVSMPIPGTSMDCKYSDISFPGGGTYLDAWDSLIPRGKKAMNCHLDPDIRTGIRKVPENWKPAFGQCDQAQTHLKNNNVKPGDLFLFFGWFRQTEYVDGYLKYVKGAPDINVIYGYLQVGEIVDGEAVKKFWWHPHSHNKSKNNTIYVASPSLVIDEIDTGLPGSGTLLFSENLVLTAAGQTHSRWKLIDVLKDKNIKLTYHPDKSHCIREGYFQSTARGQEFVFDESGTVTRWAKDIIINNIEDNVMNCNFDRLMEQHCWILDILPKRVPAENAEKYTDLEKIFLHTEELERKFFNVLMKLRCYYNFKVVLPDGKKIDDISADVLKELVGHRYIQILVDEALIVSDPDDMYMSLFNPSDEMLEIIKTIGDSEGICVWKSSGE